MGAAELGTPELWGGNWGGISAVVFQHWISNPGPKEPPDLNQSVKCTC